MATERQIAANKKNAQRSTGPTSEEGRSQSRLNATKHGLTSELADSEAGFSPEFEARRAKWAVTFSPEDEPQEWALDRVVTASFRIERCEQAIDHQISDHQERARLAWDEDREVEAATLFARIVKDPVLTSRKLQQSLAGVRLLIEAWFLLIATLEAGQDWSDEDRSRALDLLGIAVEGRSTRTLIDPPDGTNPIAFRLSRATEELERLEELRDEAMVRLDEMERRQAMAGHSALLSKAAKLLLRYEREAWSRYHRAMKQLQGSTAEPAVAPIEPKPAPRPVATPAPVPVATPTPSFEDERRALLAAAAPFVKAATDPLIAMGITDEDAWLDALEKRIEAVYSLPGSTIPVAVGSPQVTLTERTQFGDGSAAQVPGQ